MGPCVFHQVDLTETLEPFVAVVQEIRAVQSAVHVEIVQVKMAH